MKKIYIKPEIEIAEEENNMSESVIKGSYPDYRPDIGQAKKSDWELSGPFETFESSESSETTGSLEIGYEIPGID